MKNISFPFIIGQDYEAYEFDLEIIDYERIPNYDSYLYLGEVKKFLNFISVKTELIFYWDRLEFVILTFTNMENNTIEDFKRKLHLSFKIPSSNHNLECEFYKCKNTNLKFYLLNKTPKTLILIYGNSKKIHEAYLNVLDEKLE